MEITRRTDYAIRLLVELAARGESAGPISVRAMAEARQVPYAFARGIQRELAEAGLVRTVRGVRGGMVLARPAKEISLLEIVVAIQGPVCASVCTSDLEWCRLMKGCRVHAVWNQVDKMVSEYLGKQDLAGLAGTKEAEVKEWTS